MEEVANTLYTKEQLELLAKMIDDHFDPDEEDVLLTMRGFIEDNKGDSFKCIIELVGMYIHLMTREEAEKRITPILDAELCELYDYIDDRFVYKSIIARWRLSIGL